MLAQIMLTLREDWSIDISAPIVNEQGRIMTLGVLQRAIQRIQNFDPIKEQAIVLPRGPIPTNGPRS
jgi:hypothetical protein